MEKTFFSRTGELVWEEIFDLTFFFGDNIYSVFCLPLSKVWGTKM